MTQGLKGWQIKKAELNFEQLRRYISAQKLGLDKLIGNSG